MNTDMSFRNIIDLAYFPLGYRHCFDGSVLCRFVSLADNNTELYIRFYDPSLTVFL